MTAPVVPIQGDRLGPCPFCGGQESTLTAFNDEPEFYIVGCATCHTQGPSKITEAEAIVAWNTRTSSTAELLEALELAKQTIRTFHGINCKDGSEPYFWGIYDAQSPEMRQINAALAKARGQ